MIYWKVTNEQCVRFHGWEAIDKGTEYGAGRFVIRNREGNSEIVITQKEYQKLAAL